MAKALSKLNARSRWAVTGTPIQNHLKDFSALLSFLRVYPYFSQNNFDRDISILWKDGNEEEAKRRLIRLSRHLLLRRPRKTVSLPPRKDLLCPIDFNPRERAFYDEIRDGVIAQLDEVMISAPDVTDGRPYMNALQRLEAMRMVCDLGVYYQHRHQVSDALHQSMDSVEWEQVAQQSFARYCEIAPVHCHGCNTDVHALDFESSDAGAMYFAQCLRFYCSNCAKSVLMVGDAIKCDHDIWCPIARVSLDSIADDSFPLAKGIDAHQPIVLSTKVASLVAQIKALAPGVKR